MSKFHIGKNGPATCKATKGKCPLGGESGSDNHFNSLKEAEEAFAKQNNGSLSKPLSKDKQIKMKIMDELSFSKNSNSHLSYSTIKELKASLKEISDSSNPSVSDYAKDLGIDENRFKNTNIGIVFNDGEGNDTHVVIDYDFNSNEIIIQQPIEYSELKVDDWNNTDINNRYELL